MNTKLQQFAFAMVIMLLSATAQASPMVLPDPATSASESGSFTVSTKDEITLNGSHISLTTSLPTTGTIASGSARFMSGDLQYHDGASNVDGKIAKVTFGSQTIGNQVVYILKGLVYGTLSKGGQNVDVNGNFSVTTKSAPADTTLSQAQVDSSHLVLTIRSNINNTVPVN